MTGNLLTISGHREQSSEKKCDGYCYCERSYGSFRRSIELPDTTDLGKVSAEHRNGVLCVRRSQGSGSGTAADQHSVGQARRIQAGVVEEGGKQDCSSRVTSRRQEAADRTAESSFKSTALLRP